MTFILQKGIEEMSDLSQVCDTFLIVILQILLPSIHHLLRCSANKQAHKEKAVCLSDT